MKTLAAILILHSAACVAAADESLKPLTKQAADVSKMDWTILSRSVTLLGSNFKKDVPKFSQMIYDDREDKTVEFYTVSADQVDRVLAGDKTAREVYTFKFKVEYTALRNYIKVFDGDYNLEMSYATVGGGKGFIVSRDGIRKR